jgi:hypothetical protein
LILFLQNLTKNSPQKAKHATNVFIKKLPFFPCFELQKKRKEIKAELPASA